MKNITDENNSLPYRENVCLLIFNSDKKLFLGERAGYDGVWQFPQGGVEPEFSLSENALKEANEELGVDKSLFKIIKQLNHTYQYDYFSVPKYAIGKYRGQSQTFWLIEFKGTDNDINLDLYDKEFQNWMWADVNEIRTKAEPRRLKGYEIALVEFEKFLLGLS